MVQLAVCIPNMVHGMRGRPEYSWKTTYIGVAVCNKKAMKCTGAFSGGEHTNMYPVAPFFECHCNIS